jgi:hypothetical protein
MFFFHDECDFVDDDQYDFFTLAIQIERRHNRSHEHKRVACCGRVPVESESPNQTASDSAGGTPTRTRRRNGKQN